MTLSLCLVIWLLGAQLWSISCFLRVRSSKFYSPKQAKTCGSGLGRSWCRGRGPGWYHLTLFVRADNQFGNSPFSIQWGCLGVVVFGLPTFTFVFFFTYCTRESWNWDFADISGSIFAGGVCGNRYIVVVYSLLILFALRKEKDVWMVKHLKLPFPHFRDPTVVSPSETRDSQHSPWLPVLVLFFYRRQSPNVQTWFYLIWIEIQFMPKKIHDYYFFLFQHAVVCSLGIWISFYCSWIVTIAHLDLEKKSTS